MWLKQELLFDPEKKKREPPEGRKKSP